LNSKFDKAFRKCDDIFLKIALLIPAKEINTGLVHDWAPVAM
jgi:hypothetical protein